MQKIFNYLKTSQTLNGTKAYNQMQLKLIVFDNCRYFIISKLHIRTFFIFFKYRENISNYLSNKDFVNNENL